MKLHLLIIFTLLTPSLNQDLKRGDNGGISCAACTILLSISTQLAQIYNETTVDSLTRFCTYLPQEEQPECQNLVQYLAPIIASELYHHVSVDMVCYSIGLCYVQPGRSMCHLFPLPQTEVKFAPRNPIISGRKLLKSFPWICYLPGIYRLCQAVTDTYEHLVPALDHDNDKFSPAESLRGSIWRGRDCSDFSAQFRPGRRPLHGDMVKDSNCNGIWGVNASSGLTWEEELCGASDAKGIIYVGDSVGAHFHVPPAWFTPSLLSQGILTNLSYVVSNEFDWPDVGFATGFRNATYMPDLIFDDKVDSIYLRLKERNLCNHRDYQNLARNGATSFDTLEYIKSLSRVQYQDKPAILIYSMVGNDVCNEKEDTLNHMTTPTEFYQNVLETLQMLESTLPANSHVILVGLIDGSILYKAMAKRYHPLGLINKDLTYEQVYQWFNCMEIGPCHGWMSSNSTLRKITTEKAEELSRVLLKLSLHEKFTRFDVHYMPNPFEKVIQEWVAKGGQIWQLIEPVDSLHPTQVAQNLIAKSFWQYLEENIPHVLGPTNPKNPDIRKLFGDQGGH